MGPALAWWFSTRVAFSGTMHENEQIPCRRRFLSHWSGMYWYLRPHAIRHYTAGHRSPRLCTYQAQTHMDSTASRKNPLPSETPEFLGAGYIPDLPMSIERARPIREIRGSTAHLDSCLGAEGDIHGIARIDSGCQQPREPQRGASSMLVAAAAAAAAAGQRSHFSHLRHTQCDSGR